MRAAPQYTLDVRSWKTGTEVASDTFKADIPSAARKLTPVDLVDFDEMPSRFAPEGGR